MISDCVGCLKMAKSYEQIKRELETVKEYYEGKRAEIRNNLINLQNKCEALHSSSVESASAALSMGDVIVASSIINNSICNLKNILDILGANSKYIKKIGDDELKNINNIIKKNNSK